MPHPAPLFLSSFPTPYLSFSKICNEACVNKLAPSTFLMKHTLSSQHTVTSEPTAIIHTTAQFNLIQSLSCLVFHKSECMKRDWKVVLATGFSPARRFCLVDAFWVLLLAQCLHRAQVLFEGVFKRGALSALVQAHKNVHMGGVDRNEEEWGRLVSWKEGVVSFLTWLLKGEIPTSGLSGISAENFTIN